MGEIKLIRKKLAIFSSLIVIFIIIITIKNITDEKRPVTLIVTGVEFRGFDKIIVTNKKHLKVINQLIKDLESIQGNKLEESELNDLILADRYAIFQKEYDNITYEYTVTGSRVIIQKYDPKQNIYLSERYEYYLKNEDYYYKLYEIFGELINASIEK
ncbi:MAG: hypothetical protein K0R15_2736 [Clostridiales bacterium]|nr:hypothetical protein [Clostridiales bacterium]